MLKYTYKDGFRDWWTISLEKIGSQPTELPDEDSVDSIWRYSINRGQVGASTELYSSTIVGQYDIVPGIQDIILDFISYIQTVVLDMAVHAQFKQEL